MLDPNKTYDVAEYASPIGNITLASDGNALAGLWFSGQKYFPNDLSNAQSAKRDAPILAQAAKWLDEYFAGTVPELTPPLALDSLTPFRKAVSNILLTIPYGQTVTYQWIAGQIAAQTGKSVCARAVGGAVGHNPISLIVPCHRVVGANGGLTGYAGGIDRKIFLLQLEGVSVQQKPTIKI